MANQEIDGIFEPAQRGGGWIRSSKSNYMVRPGDPQINADIVQKFGLRGGERLSAVTQRDRRKRDRSNVNDIITINDQLPDARLDTAPFNDLTVISPTRRITFETPGGPLPMRVVDLLTPIGLGQRALIVAAPRTGKTILLQQMAAGVAANHPDVYIIVLLIDERPEEVTDMRRNVNGEVVASSNDHDVASHVRIAKLMIANAKRRVEAGQHVLILLDSLTRLGRAFNAHIRGSGRIMSGGLDIRALTEPKSIFGAARTIENGGSLTIVASILIETGSRMDDVIFNEFKGTGNMEIMLSRELANKRIWPAMDVQQSGTRKEELLLTPEELAKAHKIRRASLGRSPEMEMENLLDVMGRYESNAAFIAAK